MKTPKYVSADEAVSHIPSHCHVHLSSVASVPHCLIPALCRRADAGGVTDLRVHHVLTEGPAPSSDPADEGSFVEPGATPTTSPCISEKARNSIVTAK